MTLYVVCACVLRGNFFSRLVMACNSAGNDSDVERAAGTDGQREDGVEPVVCSTLLQRQQRAVTPSPR